MAVQASSFGFFDFQTGDDDTYKYTSDEFSQFVSAICGNGICYSYGGRFTYSYTSGSNNVTIQSGLACKDGRWGFFNYALNITIPSMPSKNYVIYIMFDTTNRLVYMDYVNSSSAPANSIGICRVTTGSDGSISNITNLRNYFYSNTTSSARIVFSETQPSSINPGTIWLKPIS